MKQPKIIFISHSYPPIVGGVETQNYELFTWLSKLAPVTIIANGRGRKYLPVFAPYALIKTLCLLHRHDVVMLGSGVLAILGWFIKIFSNKPVISVIHGLDINYNSSSLGVWYEKFLVFVYQSLWAKMFIPKLDRLIAVGNETIRIAINNGIPEKKLVFIPNGVDSEKHMCDVTRKDLSNIIGQDVEHKKVLLTTGRLAKRKGVAWFISNVMPKLDNDFIYIVVGDGPDKKNIEDAITENRLQGRVITLGYVPDEQRNILWNTADLFVQPNIKVPGDLEGFGISVIEAGACRLPVLASNLEGLKDAIKDGYNGFLIESENADAYTLKINELFSKGNPRQIYGESVRQFIQNNYEWHHISQLYLEEIKKCQQQQNSNDI